MSEEMIEETLRQYGDLTELDSELEPRDNLGIYILTLGFLWESN
ncbi:hypothetical protein [Thomasclavelia sp.]